jgi:hypothetical protein
VRDGDDKRYGRVENLRVREGVLLKNSKVNRVLEK